VDTMLRRHDVSIAKQCCRGHLRAAEEEGDNKNMWKKIWRKNLDDGFQVQLGEHGGNRTRWN